MLKSSAITGTCFSIMLVFALPSALMAVQAETPWYPAPETLFAPGVEVEAVIVEDVPQYSRPANEPQFDNEARQLRIFDPETEQWLEFAYPESIPQVTEIRPYEGDIWLISTLRGRGVYGNGIEPRGQWLLNIKTGVFTQPELICGELRETRADFEGQWVAFTEPPANTAQQLPATVELCHTKTLERQTFSLYDTPKVPRAYPSPDGSKIAFIGWRGYYVYNLETDALLRLGEGRSYDIQGMRWYGNRYVLVTESQMADMSYPWLQVSLGDATQEDSLVRLTTTLKFGGGATDFRWAQNPERIEWTEYDENEERCYLNWLEEDTGREERFPIDLLCTVGTILTDDPLGDRLFVRNIYAPVEITGSEDEPTFLRLLYREVVRYNLTTGERTDLLEDEVELIFEIDAASNYAAIVLDQDGSFDLQERDLAPHNILRPETLQPHDYQLAILNLHTGKILYRYRVGDTWDTYYYGYSTGYFDAATGRITSTQTIMNTLAATPTGSAFSIGNGQFIVRSFDVGRQDAPSPYRFLDDRLVEIEENEAVETILPGLTYLMTADSRQFVMVAPARDGSASVSVYDRESRLDTELISQLKIERQFGTLSELQWNDYSLGIVRGNTPDMIDVSLVNNELNQRAIYRVRLPN
jgi:hypothetical protein